LKTATTTIVSKRPNAWPISFILAPIITFYL
jgi:hypothetical protein